MKKTFLLLLPTIGIHCVADAFHMPKYRSSSTSAKSTVTSSPTLRVKEQPVKATLPNKPLVQRPKWGTDPNESADEYWYDQRIHTLGNIGLTGALHAALAPVSTKIIDLKAYEGIDVRRKVRNCAVVTTTT